MNQKVLYTHRSTKEFATAYILNGHGITKVESRSLAVVEANGYNPYVVLHKPPRKQKARSTYGRAVLIVPGDDLPTFNNYNLKTAEGVSYGMQKHAMQDPAWLVEWEQWKKKLAEWELTPVFEVEKEVPDEPISTGSGVFKITGNGLEELAPCGPIEPGKIYITNFGSGQDIKPIYVLANDGERVKYFYPAIYADQAFIHSESVAILGDAITTGEAMARKSPVDGTWHKSAIGGTSEIPDDWQPLVDGHTLHCKGCNMPYISAEVVDPFYCTRCAESKALEDSRKGDKQWKIAKEGYSKDVAAEMRRLLSARGITCLSITKGRGTGSGYIDIRYRDGFETPENALQVTRALGLNRPAVGSFGIVSPEREDRYTWLKRCAGKFPADNWLQWYPKVDLQVAAGNLASRPEGVSVEELAAEKDPEGWGTIGRSAIFLLEFLANDREITRASDGRYYQNVPEDLKTETAETVEAPEAGSEDEPAVEYDRDWTWLSWPTKPCSAVLEAIKGLGFRWSKKRGKWYATQHISTADILATLGNAPADALNVQSEDAPDNAPKGDEKLAEKLEGLADGLDQQIEKKENTFAGAKVTARRQRFIESALQEARGLRYAQIGLRELARLAREGGKLPVSATKKRLVDLGQSLAWKEDKMGDPFYESRYLENPDPDRDWLEALVKGSKDPEAEKRAEIRKLEAEMEINRPAGYFSTPDPTAEILLRHAPDLNGKIVLEPSAGSGALVESILSRWPEAVIDCLEIVPKLQRILELKGFNVVSPDFLEYAPGPIYDAVIMNPPFEDGQDMIHIRHAYDCLKEDGTLLAVASKGVSFRKDRKTTEFREWLDEVGGYIEDLPEKSFAPATNVAAVYIYLTK